MPKYLRSYVAYEFVCAECNASCYNRETPTPCQN